MINRDHNPAADGSNIRDGEAAQTSTGKPTGQTEQHEHEVSHDMVIRDCPPFNVNRDNLEAFFQYKKEGMKTSSIYHPAASHIRLWHHNVEFLIPPCVPVDPVEERLSIHLVDCFGDAEEETPQPPVTANGLSPLCMSRLVNNLKFRHDINFDSEMHYGANLDGNMGRCRTAQNDKFWNRLERDLTAFTHDPRVFLNKHGQNWTLPCVLKDIKAIVVTLVDRPIVAVVEETLEIDHLMQEISRNVADLERWAGMVAQFLRECCAPMRDGKVKDMEDTLVDGHRHHDIRILCKGIRNLLFLVEAMALDVANHQIRRMKHQIIIDTVSYERYHIEKMVETGEFDIPNAYEWYKYYHETDIPAEFAEQCFQGVLDERHDFTWFEYDERASGLYKGIIHQLAYPLRGKELPYTFIADFERFGRLRAGLLEAVNFEICIDILKHFIKSCGWSQRRVDSETALLRRHLWYILGDHCQEIDLMIPISEFRTSKERCLSIPRRFIQQKWKVAAPAVAVEILRASTLPLNMLPQIEADLVKSLAGENSPRFMKCQAESLYRLGGLIENALGNWDKLNSLQLYLAAAKPPVHESDFWCHKINPNNGPQMIVRHLARVITHMGIHHWRIWQPMAYSPYSRYIDPSQRDESSPMEERSRPPTRTIVPEPANCSSYEARPRHINEPEEFWLGGNLTGDTEGPHMSPSQEHSHAIVSEGVPAVAMPQKNDQALVADNQVEKPEKLPRRQADDSSAYEDDEADMVADEDTIDLPQSKTDADW